MWIAVYYLGYRASPVRRNIDNLRKKPATIVLLLCIAWQLGRRCSRRHVVKLVITISSTTNQAPEKSFAIFLPACLPARFMFINTFGSIGNAGGRPFLLHARVICSRLVLFGVFLYIYSFPFFVLVSSFSRHNNRSTAKPVIATVTQDCCRGRAIRKILDSRGGS